MSHPPIGVRLTVNNSLTCGLIMLTGSTRYMGSYTGYTIVDTDRLHPKTQSHPTPWGFVKIMITGSISVNYCLVTV